jgi:hypothetical protein
VPTGHRLAKRKSVTLQDLAGEHFVVVPLRAINYTTSFVFGWAKSQQNPVLARMIEIVMTPAKNGN